MSGSGNPAPSDAGVGGALRALPEGGAAAVAAHAHGGVQGHLNAAAAHGKKSARPSLARILLSLESNSAKQQV